MKKKKMTRVKAAEVQRLRYISQAAAKRREGLFRKLGVLAPRRLVPEEVELPVVVEDSNMRVSIGTHHAYGATLNCLRAEDFVRRIAFTLYLSPEEAGRMVNFILGAGADSPEAAAFATGILAGALAGPRMYRIEKIQDEQ